MNYEEITKQQLNNYLDESTQKSLSEKLSNLSDGLTDKLSLDEILNNTLNGKNIFDNTGVIDGLKDLAVHEIKSTIFIAIQIVIICIALALIKNIVSDKMSQVEGVGRYVCILLISGIILRNFVDIYQYVLDTIGGITDIMTIILPIILTVLVASGGISSGAILSPMLITVLDVFANVVKYLILPLMFLSVILRIFNSLTEKNYVNNLSELSYKSSVIICGGLAAALSGVITVQGLLTDASDGLLMDATKYSLGNFIPIVGGFTSDTLDLFLNCMSTIKSVLGVFAIIGIVLVLAVPIIKILLVSLIYKVISVVIEPICDEKITMTISKIGTSLFALTGVVVFSGTMFIIFITIILKLGA